MKPKVLVGDSEGWAVEIFAQAAERLGFDLRHARNGVEVIEMFKTLAPSLVILDTLLPKVDGLQAAKKIRDMELGRITPLVVSSAIYRQGAQIEPLRARFGFTDFLEKPFTLDTVVELCRHYLSDEGEAPSAEEELYEEGAPVRIPAVAETSLGELGVPALLCQLYRGRRSGVLTLRQDDITKVIFFERGLVTHARSNSRRDRLGRQLLRNKRVDREDYERARRLQTEASGAMPIGQALVHLGVLSENDVLNAVSSQVLSIVFSVFPWSRGSWSFLETSNLPADCTGLSFNTANLVFWGLRQLEGQEDFQRFLPGARAFLERPADASGLRDSLSLTYFEDQILSLVDGRRRLGEIAAIGRLARIDVSRVLFSLLVLGVLRVRTEGAADSRLTAGGTLGMAERSVEGKGNLETTSMARLLSRMYLAGESGVVLLRADDRESEIHLDRGEVVYARSNQAEYRLGSILLSSGKVTQEEYDAATNRLGDEPGRRIGSLFLELRALSLEELDWALRFQVQAVVLDALRWQRGEYAFEETEPPEDLMVTLSVSTPDLILEGARSAPAPGGVSSLLASPDTLVMRMWAEERLARLVRLSAAEQRLLSFIEAGRTVREIRGLGVMGDEELARVLHGLLALEIVRVARGTSLRPAPLGDPTSTLLTVPDTSEEETPFPASVRPGGREAELTGEIRIAGQPAAEAAPSTEQWDVVRRENEALRRAVVALEAELRAVRESGQRPKSE